MDAADSESLVVSYILGVYDQNAKDSQVCKTLSILERHHSLRKLIPVEGPICINDIARIHASVTNLDHFIGDENRVPPAYCSTCDADPLRDLEVNKKWKASLQSLEHVLTIINRCKKINHNQIDVLSNSKSQINTSFETLFSRVMTACQSRIVELLSGPQQGTSWAKPLQRIGMVARATMGLGSSEALSSPDIDDVFRLYAKFKNPLLPNQSQEANDQAVENFVCLEYRMLLQILVNSCLRGRRSLQNLQLHHMHAIHLIFKSSYIEKILDSKKLPPGFWGNSSQQETDVTSSLLPPEILRRMNRLKKKNNDGIRLEVQSMLSVLMPPCAIDQVYYEHQSFAADKAIPFLSLIAGPEKLEYFKRYQGREGSRKYYLSAEAGQINEGTFLKSLRNLTPQHVKTTIESIGADQNGAIEVTVNMIKTLCRTPSLQTTVLEWFANALACCDHRCTLQGEQLEDYIYSSEDDLTKDVPGIAHEKITALTEGHLLMPSAYAILVTLLRLLKPIKSDRYSAIDPNYLARCNIIELDGGKKKAEGTCADLIGQRLLTESTRLNHGKMCDFKNRDESTAPYQVGFINSLFWLTLRAMAVVMRPLVSRYTNLSRACDSLHHNRGWKTPEFVDRMSLLVIYRGVTENKYIMQDSAKFTDIFQDVMMKMCFASGQYGAAVPEDNTAFWSLPVEMLRGSLKHLNLAISADHSSSDFAGLDVKRLLELLLTLITSCTEIYNPAEVLKEVFDMILFVLRTSSVDKMTLASKFKVTLIDSSKAKKDLFPAIAKCFVFAQKSDYHTRLQARYEYTNLLQLLLNVDRNMSGNTYGQSFRDWASIQDDLFGKFIHQFVMSLSTNIEEGLVALAEVKARNDRGETEESARRDREARQVSRMRRTQARRRDRQQRSELQMAEDDDSPSGDEDESESDENPAQALMETEYRPTVDAMDLVRLCDMCRMYIRATNSSLEVFKRLVGTSASIICGLPTQLSEVSLSLNCCLDLLAGPKCSSLKVDNFASYNFDPLDNLTSVVICYIDLLVESGTSLPEAEYDITSLPWRMQSLKTIVREERYFRIGNFEKALHVMKTKSLLSKQSVQIFGICVDMIRNSLDEEEARKTKLEEIDIPDEFLDPIMGEIMINPVKLPQSGKIVDRSVLERHVMNEESDPFTRMPLQMEEIIPQVELQTKINEWMQQHGLLD